MSPKKLARSPLKGIPQNPLLEVPKWFTEIPPKTLLTVLDFGTIFEGNLTIEFIDLPGSEQVCQLSEMNLPTKEALNISPERFFCSELQKRG